MTEEHLPPTLDEAAVAARLERLRQRRGPAAATATSRPARPARRHPARRARWAAAGMSVLSTAGLTSLFIGDAGGQQGSATIVQAPSTSASPAATAPAGQSPTTDAAAVPSAVVDGAVFRNRWGNVQVEATFAADGSLASVTALEVPGGRGRSIQINDYAVPRLNADAVAAQNADVHTVSGATYTSDSYRSSLQSAIDAARAASITTIS